MMTALALVSLTSAKAQTGQVYSWGANNLGQRSGAKTAPATIVQVSAGGNHTLALDTAGAVWAWGDNRSGQLGDGTNTPRATAAQIAGITKAVQVAAGLDFSLVLTADGNVWAFGNNADGQLGDGTTTAHNTPIQVPRLANVLQVSAGSYHSLALVQGGTVRAWGAQQSSHNAGQTADGSTTKSISGLTNVIQVSAGYLHSAAIKLTGSAWAWGWNRYGQVGNGNTNTFQTTPSQMSGLANIQQVSAGGYHTLVLGGDGTVWATGGNDFGEIGDGTTASRKKAVQVPGISNAVQVSAGFQHSEIAAADGTLWGWGDNQYGQVGAGGGQPHSPVKVTGDTTGAANTFVSAGGFHTASVSAVMLATNVSSNIDAALTVGYGNTVPTNLTTKLTLKDSGFPLIQQPVSIMFGGTDYGTKVTDTTATWNIPFGKQLTPGAYNIAINYPGNRLYQAAAFSGVLTVTKAVTTLANTGITQGQIGQTVGMAVQLGRSSDNTVLANRTIHINLDGKLLADVTTDDTGTAKYPYFLEVPLTVGKHPLSFVYDGDDNHLGVTKKGVLTVKQSPSLVNVGSISGRYGNSRTIVATLKRNSDKKLLEGETIDFLLDDVKIGSATTDANGKASFPYLIDEPLTVGVHNISAVYAGTANYIGKTSTAKLTVVITGTKISQASRTGKVGATVNLDCLLRRGTDNKPLAGRTITFSIDDVVIDTAVTNDAGHAILPYVIPDITKGKHKLTVSFAGDDFYLTNSDSVATLTVK